jgi:hypothetical protein
VKKMRCLVAVLLMGALTGSSMAYTPPTDDQIAGVLADHSQLNVLLQGANPDQAAAVVAQALAKLDQANLPAGSKSQTAALLYTRALLLSGESAPQMAGSLASKVKPEVLPVLSAATAIAVGSSEGSVFAAIAKAAGSNAAVVDAIAAAAANPASALGEDSVALVQQLVIELRGVAAPVIPPPATAPMNLVPPIVPQGTQTPAPPVADAYANQ